MINNGVASIEQNLSELNIEVPASKNWFTLVFSVVWLFGWVFGLVTASGSAFTNDTAKLDVESFMLIWLTMWTVGGIAVIANVLWGFFGKEKLLINSFETRFEKTIFNIGIKKKLQSSELKNFRFELIEESATNKRSFIGFGPGKIKFDYGFKTYSFGLGLDDAEAQHIVSLLRKRYKEE
ncbi:MAG: hypothetical protein IT236_18440 [Bacteroidia bacterium]|nr:hypothetical protein [Bacteroidia bacterium]